MRDVTALEQHQPARDGLHLERLLGSLTRGVPRPASEKALERATVLRGRPVCRREVDDRLVLWRAREEATEKTTQGVRRQPGNHSEGREGAQKRRG